MDILQAMRQSFAHKFGHAPSDVELADMFLAQGIMLHADGGEMTPSQILSRVQSMLTPGAPLNSFLRKFK